MSVCIYTCMYMYVRVYVIYSFVFVLQEAQKMADFILRHGNDLLAVECLKGFEVHTLYMYSACHPGI